MALRAFQKMISNDALLMLYRTEIFTTERTVGMKRWFSNEFNLPNRISRPCVAHDFGAESRRILNQSNAVHCKHCACGSGGRSRISRRSPQNRAMFRNATSRAHAFSVISCPCQYKRHANRRAFSIEAWVQKRCTPQNPQTRINKGFLRFFYNERLLIMHSCPK